MAPHVFWWVAGEPQLGNIPGFGCFLSTTKHGSPSSSILAASLSLFLISEKEGWYTSNMACGFHLPFGRHRANLDDDQAQLC
jgi:hypothetical protein